LLYWVILTTDPMTTPEQPPLDERSIDSDPMRQFALWYADAERTPSRHPMAMTLATASPDGTPSARIVLLKQSDARGFIFYTNYRSRKSRELDENPRASLVFFWDDLDRQVRAEGTVTRVSAAESDAYFATRPRESQIGAHASAQSQPIASRALLEEEAAKVARAYEGQSVPRPGHWGGFCLAPTMIEFWQGRIGRLHDRIRYRRNGELWTIERLSP
jgi:pyridoxamine 5'-phosphate oxidase